MEDDNLLNKELYGLTFLCLSAVYSSSLLVVGIEFFLKEEEEEAVGEGL